MAKRDYYEVLGVSKSATADELKRAYRQLAHKYHPDKDGGNEAKFKELGEAYAVLSDSQKRQQYDQFGHAGPMGSGFETGNGAGGFQDFDFSGMSGFGDIFDMFFRGGQPGRGQTRGRDIEIETTIDFKDAVFGANREVELNLEDVCERCDGSGAEPGSGFKTCPTCSGSGQVSTVQRTIIGTFSQASICGICHGRGQVPEKSCTECHGRGTKRRHKTVSLRIPAGIDNGATLRLAGLGEATVGGHQGDLYVHIRVRPSSKFVRRGNDITSRANIPMVEAALGTEIPVETVDGQVKLKVPAGTQSGKVFKLSDRGVPNVNGRGRGDHLVEVKVETPTRLSAKQKALLEEFEDTAGKKRFWDR